MGDGKLFDWKAVAEVVVYLSLVLGIMYAVYAFFHRTELNQPSITQQTK